MKYNKSEIMKNAWADFKALKNYPMSDSRRNRTFGDCLRQAWFSAKKAAKEAAELAALIGRKFAQDMEITINYVTYTLRRWTNYGKDRVYVAGGRGHDKFVDLKSNYDNLGNQKLASIIRAFAY